MDEDQLCVCCVVMCAEISCLSFGVPIGYSSPLTLTDQVNCSLCVCLSVCWLVWAERCAYICLFCLCVGWSDCQSLHEWGGVLTSVCFVCVLVGLTLCSPYMSGEVCLHLSILSVCWLVWLSVPWWIERCAYICLFCLCVGWSDSQSLLEWRSVLTSVLSVCWLVWLSVPT